MKQKAQSNSDLDAILDEMKVLKDKLHSLELQGKEIQLFLRILVHPILMSELSVVFKNAKQLRAYELSNGERSTRDIGQIVKIDQKGISNWWREWEREGLVDKVGTKGQFKARYTLLELLVVSLPTRKQKSLKENHHG